MEWISVKDSSYPVPFFENVLIYTKLGIFIGNLNPHLNGNYWNLTDWHINECQEDYEPVTHWMPLPKPPKE